MMMVVVVVVALQNTRILYTAYYGYTLRTCNKSNVYKQTVYVYYVRLGTHCHTCKSIIGGWSPNINALLVRHGNCPGCGLCSEERQRPPPWHLCFFEAGCGTKFHDGFLLYVLLLLESINNNTTTLQHCDNQKLHECGWVSKRSDAGSDIETEQTHVIFRWSSCTFHFCALSIREDPNNREPVCARRREHGGDFVREARNHGTKNIGIPENRVGKEHHILEDLESAVIT